MTKALYNLFSQLIAAVLIILIGTTQAKAFDLSHYTEESVLSTGRWVKIGVEQSGLYMISTQTLRSWGFNDPAKVKIYGYGGNRIDDILSTENYIDDLPQIASAVTDKGIIFYGVGIEKWTASTSNPISYYSQYKNPYSLMGYYFVTQGVDNNSSEIATSGKAEVVSPVTTVMGRVQYEKDLYQAAESGPLMVGEDFRYTHSQSFTITTPGRVPNSNVYMECQFIASHVGTTSDLFFTIDGANIDTNNSDHIAATNASNYVHASIGVARHQINPAGEKFTVGIRHSCSGNLEKANLDYLSFSYERKLELPSEGALVFWSNSSELSMAGIKNDIQIWDVTDPQSISKINYVFTGGNANWSSSYDGVRTYAAWQQNATLPEPQFIEYTSNQNLHAVGEPIDMVIFTSSTLTSHAKRIADIHRDVDTMNVQVVDVSRVYNEFASGCADISALRKYLKMVYDRGKEAGRPLRYALLLGRTTLDHCKILPTTQALGYTTMPAWVVREARHSLSDNDGFSTDDFVAMLEDNSGSDLGLDHLSIAVGRIPMISERDGAEIVDKLYQYVYKSKRTGWKNHMMVLADDEDGGVHLRDIEQLAKNILATPNQQHLITKIYLDAYTLSSGEYPEARREMFQALDDGVAWWFYAGHANNHSWTGEHQLTYSDINSMYLRNIPVLVAATCDFLCWDSETTSGGEIMYKERYGGVVAMISATRPVYITDNGYFMYAIGRTVLARDKDGRFLPAGEVYRRAKNDIRDSKNEHISNPNRLRFVFMGDPAMRVTTPDNIVELLTINGKPVNKDAQITIAAMENVTITGRVVDPHRNLLSDFNGSVTINLYDALKSRVAKEDDRVDVFDVFGDKLYAGATTVKNGEFTMTFAMPSLISDNFRPAAMSLYAAADNSQAEAVGVNRVFYVSGFKEPETTDTIAPCIDHFVLNHSEFKSGQTVNSAPMVIAHVSDNVGINLSLAGVGQQMTLTLDGINTYTDVASFYTPASDGSISGTINYPLENLSKGAHTLRFRVFDTSGNASETTIDFLVDESLAPQIFDVYSDANPAYEQANFYVRHDRPETILNVTIEVFDLLGHPIWQSSSKGLSDMDISAPVTWNLTNEAGQRVNRGIYLYRATITTDNANYVTASRRIAVAGL